MAPRKQERDKTGGGKVVPYKPRLMDVHRVDGEGRLVTVGDAVVGAVRAGASVDIAARMCDLTMDTVWRYRRDGKRINGEIEAGLRTEDDLTDKEYALWAFARDIDRAFAEWEVRATMTLEQAASGRMTRTTTTTRRDAAGKVIETITKVEQLPPDTTVILKRLDWLSKARQLHGTFPVPDVAAGADDREARIADLTERALLAATGQSAVIDGTAREA